MTLVTEQWTIVANEDGYMVIDEMGDEVDGGETKTECRAIIRSYARHYEAKALYKTLVAAGHDLDNTEGYFADAESLPALRRLARKTGLL